MAFRTLFVQMMGHRLRRERHRAGTKSQAVNESTYYRLTVHFEQEHRAVCGIARFAVCPGLPLATFEAF